MQPNCLEEIKLSNKALMDLRIALGASYGEDLDSDLTNDQVNEIGNLLLTILAESLMLKANLIEQSTAQP